jgi:hypothetical protein
MIDYRIEPTGDQHTLYSYVETNFAGVAKNFVFTGSLCECIKKKEMLLKLL